MLAQIGALPESPARFRTGAGWLGSPVLVVQLDRSHKLLCPFGKLAGQPCATIFRPSRPLAPLWNCVSFFLSWYHFEIRHGNGERQIFQNELFTFLDEMVAKTSRPKLSLVIWKIVFSLDIPMSACESVFDFCDRRRNVRARIFRSF